jgi:hypothetical protein
VVITRVELARQRPPTAAAAADLTILNMVRVLIIAGASVRPVRTRFNRVVVWSPPAQPCEYSSLSPVDFSRARKESYSLPCHVTKPWSIKFCRVFWMGFNSPRRQWLYCVDLPRVHLNNCGLNFGEFGEPSNWRNCTSGSLAAVPESTLMRRTRSPCCARAASGQDATAPGSSATNPRRLIQ